MTSEQQRRAGSLTADDRAQDEPHTDQPGCSTCGTCMGHDGCADKQNPLGVRDCADCGACASCIARCADERRKVPGASPA